MSRSEPHWISFGVVGRAHGVRGEMRVVPGAAGISMPEGIEKVRMTSPRIGERLFTVDKIRPVHDGLLLTLKEINDRDQARELSGSILAVDAASLPPPVGDEFYVYEIEGAQVFDESGKRIGVVKALVDNNGQDLLEIKTDNAGEQLLPWVEGETVIRFDRDANAIVIRPIPGLWEDE